MTDQNPEENQPIEGQEITEEDLLPIIERFLKDSLIEVKVGALKNLHEFLG